MEKADELFVALQMSAMGNIDSTSATGQFISVPRRSLEASVSLLSKRLKQGEIEAATKPAKNIPSFNSKLSDRQECGVEFALTNYLPLDLSNHFQNAELCTQLRTSIMPQMQGGKASLITLKDGTTAHAASILNLNKYRVSNNNLDRNVVSILDNDTASDVDRKRQSKSLSHLKNTLNDVIHLYSSDDENNPMNDKSLLLQQKLNTIEGRSSVPLREINRNASVSRSTGDGKQTRYSDAEELYTAVINHCYRLSKSSDQYIKDSSRELFLHLSKRCEIWLRTCSGEISLAEDQKVSVEDALAAIDNFLPDHQF